MGQSSSSAAPSQVVNLRKTDHGPTPIDVFCEQLEAGDVLFLSGRNPISAMISTFSWCEWTHVALIDVCPASGRRFVWESQSQLDDCIDVLTRTSRKSGVRLVELRERLILYARDCGRPFQAAGDGYSLLDVAVKRLHCDSPERRSAFQKRLSEFESLESRKAYERSGWQMIRAQYSEILGPADEDTTTYFCSELVVMTYKFVGALPSGRDPATGAPLVNASAETPSGLARSSGRYRFEPGYTLGPELYELTVLVPPLSHSVKKDL